MKKIHINNDDNYATPPEFLEELNKFGKTQSGTKDSMIVVFDGTK